MQNGLQQLDLFGMPLETAVQQKKKEKLVKPAMVAVDNVLTNTSEMVAPATETLVAVKKIKVPVESSTATVTRKPGKRGRKSFKEMDSEADLVEVPEDEILQQKLYYSISEVAGWFKVNTSLLRYWENEFDILQPRKTRKGDRLFRVEDIKNLQLIYFLLRQRKFSIDGAKNFLKNNKQEADRQVKLMDALTKFKSFLLELKASL
jgi:DNA-binding transcriptional MerR regulator